MCFCVIISSSFFTVIAVMAHDMEMVAWGCDSENPKQLAPMSRGSAILPAGSASYDSLWPYIFIGPLITELL